MFHLNRNCFPVVGWLVGAHIQSLATIHSLRFFTHILTNACVVFQCPNMKEIRRRRRKVFFVEIKRAKNWTKWKGMEQIQKVQKMWIFLAVNAFCSAHNVTNATTSPTWLALRRPKRKTYVATVCTAHKPINCDTATNMCLWILRSVKYVIFPCNSLISSSSSSPFNAFNRKWN